MQEFISDNLTSIVLAAIAALIAGAAITIGIRVVSRKSRVSDSNNDNSNRVVQHGNMAGGDIVGRDKTNQP